MPTAPKKQALMRFNQKCLSSLTISKSCRKASFAKVQKQRPNLVDPTCVKGFPQSKKIWKELCHSAKLKLIGDKRFPITSPDENPRSKKKARRKDFLKNLNTLLETENDHHPRRWPSSPLIHFSKHTKTADSPRRNKSISLEKRFNV